MSVANSQRGVVLNLYKRLMRLSQTWKAKEPENNIVERNYIRDETQKLFRANMRVTDETAIKEHIRDL